MYKLYSYSAPDFNRPANTTAYAANQAVYGGSPLVIAIPTSNRPFYIRRVSCKVSSQTTAITFRLHLFTANPTPAITVTDGAIPTFTSLFSTYARFIDISTVGVGGIGQGEATNITNAIILPNNGVYWGILTTLTAFTPVASATYAIRFFYESDV